MTSKRCAPSAVLATAEQTRVWQQDLYRELHQHPELSHQEYRTAAVVAERLEEFGFEVTTGVGGTGVVGVLRHGDGPTVLLRADMDALPIREDTGLAYASTAMSTRPGDETPVPVAHACGHDMHVACLLGAAQLLAAGEKHWSGTLVALFQPAEETADGARGMVADGLADKIPPVDVALGQHVGPFPAGSLVVVPGPFMASADSIQVTVYGRGGHGSTPNTTVDPVVLAASIVMRLQTVVAREIAPSTSAVLTVGSLHAGTKANIIPDRAELQINIRTYTDAVRTQVLDAIRRIVTAECVASNSPREPDFSYSDHAPVTDNDPSVTAKIAEAFTGHFGADAIFQPQQIMGSEDFSDIANGVKAPYSFWFFGGTDPQTFAKAAAAGRLASDIPYNHSPHFAPVIQPTLDTGTSALVVAALAWLAPASN